MEQEQYSYSGRSFHVGHRYVTAMRTFWVAFNRDYIIVANYRCKSIQPASSKIISGIRKSAILEKKSTNTRIFVRPHFLPSHLIFFIRISLKAAKPIRLNRNNIIKKEEKTFYRHSVIVKCSVLCFFSVSFTLPLPQQTNCCRWYVYTEHTAA